MNWRVPLIFLVSILLASLSIVPACATESATDAEIEVSYKALFRGNLLQGFEADWLFDLSLSKMLLADFDTNRNGIFDKSELVQLNKASLPTLHESGFFTSLFVGQKETPLIAISSIKASNEKGRVRYRFSLGIAKGDIDIRGTEVVVYINDPTTITTILPAKSGAARLGDGAPPVCTIRAEQTDSLVSHNNGRRRVLFGQVHSVETMTIIYLLCEAAQVGQP